MVDWTSSMQQTFEFYSVDPGTWKDVKLINNIKSCTISRDYDADTLGSASIGIDESVGECYVRVYLITIQNGIREKHPLGTFLVQTPSSSFNGKIREVTMDAYSPLLELKENRPPIGYSLNEKTNIMDIAFKLTREHVRAPVIEATSDMKLQTDFVSDPNSDTWLTFIRDLIANAKYTFSLDELGRILFSPKQDAASLRPIWTYDDSNSSILYPDMSMDHDLYGIPNVVEVTYSNGRKHYHTRIVNDDPNSPISTVNRGREIVRRVTDPEVNVESANDEAAQRLINEYAERLLRELSSIEYTLSYTHAYCPVRIGDCVRLNYTRAGFTNIKAKVISQSIKCEPGCPVTEKAIFTTNLWG
jgi:hypothetical protein